MCNWFFEFGFCMLLNFNTIIDSAVSIDSKISSDFFTKIMFDRTFRPRSTTSSFFGKAARRRPSVPSDLEPILSAREQNLSPFRCEGAVFVAKMRLFIFFASGNPYGRTEAARPNSSHRPLSKFYKCLVECVQRFVGLVLGCVEVDFCE